MGTGVVPGRERQLNYDLVEHNGFVTVVVTNSCLVNEYLTLLY